MVRLLFDQMIDADAAGEVRLVGFDVARVADFGMSTANDDEVLGLAIHENRILVTLDEHFGDWTFLKLESHPGVIRVKAHPTSARGHFDQACYGETRVLTPGRFISSSGAVSLLRRLDRESGE